MFENVNGRDTMNTKNSGPVKTSNSEQQGDKDSSISLPNGCDQDFVFYED
jgi:hypothetical protein